MNTFTRFASAVVLSAFVVACGDGSPTAPTVTPGGGILPPAGSGASNRPPTVSRVTCSPCTVSPGRTSSIRVTASDPDGDPMTYLWDVGFGDVSPDNQRAVTLTVSEDTSAGTRLVKVTVSDNRGGVTTEELSITVSPLQRPAGVNLQDWIDIAGGGSASARRSAPNGVVRFDTSAFGPSASAMMKAVEAQAIALNPGITTGIEMVSVRVARPDERLAGGNMKCAGTSTRACSSSGEIVFASELWVEDELVFLHEALHQWGYSHGGDGVMGSTLLPVSTQDRLIFEAASYIPNGAAILP
jgi:hypothetical protein